MPLLEIASFNLPSALTAAANGAGRIELCRSQSDGGLTPSLSTFASLKASVSIPIYVMIRPHARSFTYSPSELLEMEESVRQFGRAGANGFVFGVLSGDGLVDEEVCKSLVEMAEGKPCTFHRAFDSIPASSVESQLEILVECGFQTVLTSGGAPTASEGREVLRRLVKAARGRIEVIVGGGVRSGNVDVLKGETGADVFHSSAIVDGGEAADGEEVKLLNELINK